MNPIQISILIPIYNGIEFLHQSIGSVLSQTYSHWEVILGINGHPPESYVWKKAMHYSFDKRVKVLDMADIKGKSNALNEMVKHAAYNWIAILDVDDIWYPNKLEKQVYYLEKYDIVGTKCLYFGDMNNIVPYIPNGDLSSFDFFERNPIINSSAVIKKELCYWEENGLEDYDLWLRLKRFGYSFYNIDEVLVLHRIHSDSAFNAKGNNLNVPELLSIHRIKYHITTEYYGNKFIPIIPHWKKRIEKICNNHCDIYIMPIDPSFLNLTNDYAWWDIIRLESNIKLVKNTNLPVVHIDLDIIIEKNIYPLISLPYDIIISTEIGGNSSFPKECSQKLGFGVCTGYYTIKPSGISFMENILKYMKDRLFGTYSDQVTIMNCITLQDYIITIEPFEWNGVIFQNRIIHIEGIKICVLDFELITIDPIIKKHQFGNHINIGNVGGTEQFLSYFYKPLSELPLTCRCGKHHLDDYSICPHISMRNIL